MNIRLERGVYFISGIDTDIGKTIATGYIAKQLLDQQISVITQKLVQTGNVGKSEDILKHRQMMNKSFIEDDTGLTAPQIFAYPASPHLATRLENKVLDLDLISRATDALAKKYEVVLLEGAGGLMVPLTEDLLTLEYIAHKKYPVILVTSGRLGSINHTLLSLSVLTNYGVELYAVVFNTMDDSRDQIVADDTKVYIKNHLKQYFNHAKWLELDQL